ncbi:hypothetical protein TIFTF001_005690 [Ficus carica]|uniref:Uncharacterized protein n=1 Tax=Ficus carica TaxID=3494 RepID=A0AA88CZQ1_FICCA|nr:hypothetical protein TIFTF001_005690 [Ficus carica]
MEADPKSPAEFDRLLTEQDDSVLALSPEVPIKEEKVEEFMQELYRELYSAAPPDAASFPAVDAGSETCGASVSDSASTVMAGFEFAGGNVVSAPEGGRGFWWGQVENGYYYCGRPEVDGGGGDREVDHRKKRLGKGRMDGCDLGEELDDEWLARVLNWGPVELDPWF